MFLHSATCLRMNRSDGMSPESIRMHGFQSSHNAPRASISVTVAAAGRQRLKEEEED